MKRMVPLLLTAIVACAAHADEHEGIEGILSFANGDQLHGRYAGFSQNKLQWMRDDLDATAGFELAGIRRAIFRHGQPEVALKSLTHATTVHGDRIPGRIDFLDENHIVLESEFAGTLTLPRDQLGMLAPNPLGGRIFYQGPFAENEWEIVTPNIRVARANGLRNDILEAAGGEGGPSGWTHSGAAWYWPGGAPVAALVRREALSDSVVIRCHLSWKSRISLAIAFHADFKTFAEQAGDGERDEARRRIHPSDTNIYPDIFGNAYVLQLNPSHAMLYRSQIDDDGTIQVGRMETNFNNMNLGESGSAAVEIRASRRSGEISLFINGEFVAQWSEIGHLEHAGEQTSPYVASGNGLAFLMQTPNSTTRLSDITISEWNGMPDSARSMQIDDHDIVLLTNGTDRFSGRVTGITDGRITFSGRYGDFVFPLDEVAEIRFARAGLRKPESDPANTLSMRMHPLGVLTGVPISGDARSLRINHPACGPIDVDLSAVVILDLSRSGSFLDAWDPEF